MSAWLLWLKARQRLYTVIAICLAAAPAAAQDVPKVSPAMSFFVTSTAAASAATWAASPERMRSASSVPRPSDEVIDCGARISAHHRQPMRQRSTRETGSVEGRGSTRKESRSRPALTNSTARTSISPGIRRSPRQARTSHPPGTTSSPAVTPMAPCSRVATPRAAGGRAIATAERWWGITTAAAGARAIPGILPIRRAAARRPRCARLSGDGLLYCFAAD